MIVGNWWAMAAQYVAAPPKGTVTYHSVPVKTGIAVGTAALVAAGIVGVAVFMGRKKR